MNGADPRERFGAAWPGRSAAREIEAGGVCWNVQTAGDGADIVLIHGTGASTHSWRDIIGPLSAHARVIAFDLPGHALSSAPAQFRPGLTQTAQAVAALLEKIHAAPAIIVGHSAGAAIATRMALSGLAHPHTIISINGAFLPFRGPAGRLFPPLARVASASGFASRLFAGRARDVGAVRRLIAGTGSRISEQGIELYARLFRDPAHVAGVLRMMAHWDLAPLARDLPGLEAELVLVAGTNDRAVPMRNVDFVKALASNASEIFLQGLGHLAHEEAPERATALILDELRRAPNPN